MRLRFRPFSGSAGVAASGPATPRRWSQPLRLRPPAPRPSALHRSAPRPSALHRSDPEPPIPGLVRAGLPHALPCQLDHLAPGTPGGWPDESDLVTERVEMRRYPPRRWPETGASALDDERLRPLYARVLGLRHVEPGAVLCFVFFEGTVMLGFLLALAELVSWWGVLMLPASVALMVKINDVVAAAVARSAARVPEVEQERFRQELRPAVGRAVVPESSRAPGAAAPYRPLRPGDPAGDAVPAVARVRPELATARTRPRPLPIAESADSRPDRGEPTPDPIPGAPADRSGHDEPPPGRRARNAYPVERSRRAPIYLVDRREGGSTEQWTRQSARQRYGPEDRRG